MVKQPSLMTLRRGEVPLAGAERADLSFRVEQQIGIAKLRVSPTAANILFQRTVGVAPPPPGRQIEAGAFAFAWLAPGEWLVTGEEAGVADWVARTAAELGDYALVLDFTHARVSFDLSGRSVRAAIAAHCPLDLWPEAFPEGAATRSLLGDVGIFITRLADRDGEPRFRIIVDQTMAPYARRQLVGA